MSLESNQLYFLEYCLKWCSYIFFHYKASRKIAFSDNMVLNDLNLQCSYQCLGIL